MKTKIIPAINAQILEEIKEKINLLKDLTNHFHLDVASLEFTGYQTWQNSEDLNRLNYPNEGPNNIPEYKPNGNQKFGHDSGNTFGRYSGKKSITFDLHLMLSLKPQEILKWAKENVKTLILHLEASQNPDGLLKMAKKIKKKIFIAWSPDVEFDFIKKYLNYVDGILILGVRPGRAGQKFLEETYKRIENLKSNPAPEQSTVQGRLQKRKLKLMIDGGVNEENFQKILSYEPDFIVMASAIYNSENPREKYLWFLDQIKN